MIDFIKLAWESQLTVILFKLILIKLAWESQLTVILFKLILIINGACHFNGKAQYCYCSYLLLMVLAILMAKHSIVIAHTYSSSSSTFISARYSSHSFCHRAMNEVSKRAA